MSDYKKHKEGYFRRARKSYASTFETKEKRLRRMLVEAKSRAKKRGLAFEITEKDVNWNDICPVLGIPINFEHRRGQGGNDNSPSLDRIDNSGGYVAGNVRIVSNRANKLKNTMTQQECFLIYTNWNAK